MKKILIMACIALAASCTSTKNVDQTAAYDKAALLLPDTSAVVKAKGVTSMSKMNITEIWLAYRPYFVAIQIIVEQQNPAVGRAVLAAIKIMNAVILSDYSYHHPKYYSPVLV